MNILKKSLILASVGFLAYTSSAFASFDSNIKYGTVRSDAVREIQEFLTDQGLYSGPVTGNFYTLTLRAVKAFQNREGIKPANGYWGPPTKSRAKDLAAAEIDNSNQEAEVTGENAPLSDTDVAFRFPDGSTFNSNGKQLSGPTPIEQNFSNDLCNNFQGVQLIPPAGYMPASNGDCVIIPPNVVYVPVPTSVVNPTPISSPVPTPIVPPKPTFSGVGVDIGANRLRFVLQNPSSDGIFELSINNLTYPFVNGEVVFQGEPETTYSYTARVKNGEKSITSSTRTAQPLNCIDLTCKNNLTSKNIEILSYRVSLTTSASPAGSYQVDVPGIGTIIPFTYNLINPWSESRISIALPQPYLLPPSSNPVSVLSINAPNTTKHLLEIVYKIDGETFERKLNY